MCKGLVFYLFIFNIVNWKGEKKFCGARVGVEGSYVVILKQIRF